MRCLQDHRRHLWHLKLIIQRFLWKFRFTWKLVCKLYIPNSIMCVNFIKICQVDFEYRGHKVLKSIKSMKFTSLNNIKHWNMYSKHAIGYTCKRYNTCKMLYAPSHSSLIIFCKTLCYLMVISQCMIENDISKEKRVTHWSTKS